MSVHDQPGRHRGREPRRRHRDGRPHDTPTDQPRNDARQPPHDLDAERAVLGICLLGKPDLLTQARQHLPDGHDWWYDLRHARIWRHLISLADQHEDITPTPITVADHARTSDDVWREPDDTLYLHDLHDDAPLAPQLAHHAGIVARYELTRRFDLLAVQMRQAVAAGNHDRLLERAASLRDDIDQALQAHVGGAVDTWAPLDLEPALSGGIITQPPTLMARNDGVFMIYLGRLHSLSGEPEAGKTFVALIAVIQALEDNQHVIYLDFEDTPEGIVGRLLAMGADPDWIRQRLHYIRPDRPIDEPARRHLRDLVETHFVTLAIIDGVTEAMTLHSLVPLDNTDAAIFYERLPRFLTRIPSAPAVVMIDHVPKDEDRPKRYAIGAQHKLAGLDGAAFMVDIVTPFAPGRPGLSSIRVAKDRPGQVRKHAVKGVIAEMHIDGDDEVIRAVLQAPTPDAKTRALDGHWRPTILMERVSRFVEVHPGANKNDVERAVRGKGEHIRAAIEALVLEGFLHCEPGPRKASFYRCATPFRNVPDEEEDQRMEYD